MSIDAERFFAQTYAEARGKFEAAVAAAGGTIETESHPERGRHGEPLALDVARFGAADAASVLIVSSACHGAEGFCGSGVQGGLLADASFHADAQARGVAVLYLHALNPYGFSHLRRVTQENVDLNRNWVDFSQPLPANPAYDEIAAWAVPDEWPSPAAEAALADYAAKKGLFALQGALSGGQYGHPTGLFFGGHAPTWSRQAITRVLQRHGARCRRLGWIDIHTGLGPSGHGEKIFADDDNAASLARARAWWGSEVTSTYDGSSSSAQLSGLLYNAAYQSCPRAEYTGIALEFGTLPVHDVMAALRADQWLHNHPQAASDVAERIKRQLRDAFYVDTPLWKQQIVEQGVAAARQALAGLAT
jgi:hypothetical protein